MRQSKGEQFKLELTDVSFDQSKPEVLKTIFAQSHILDQKFPQNEDCLNWVKIARFQYQMDVIFSRPMKNIEFEKSENLISKWSAFYNVQLPTIIIEKQSNQQENNIFLKMIQITQLNGQIQKVSELIKDISQQNNTDLRIEIKGQKLNTPEKLENKKKCLHHLAVCAFRRTDSKTNQEIKLIGLSISDGFCLKSRKKSHQEKGLDKGYFKPIELSQNLQQKKKKKQPVNIANNIEGLQLYFTSPNIRLKILHPLFLSIRFSEAVKLYLHKKTFGHEKNMVDKVRKICTEFSSSEQVNKQNKRYPMIIVINHHLENEAKEKDRSMDKVLKALLCAKESKSNCQYIINNEKQYINDQRGYFVFDISEKREEIVNAYKNIYQTHSGIKGCYFLNQEYNCSQTSENNSQVLQEDRLTKKLQSTTIDINKLISDKNINQLFKVQVFYSDDTSSPINNQKNIHIINDDNQGNTEDLDSQVNFTNRKESSRTINDQIEKDGLGQLKKEYIKSECGNNCKVEGMKLEISENNQSYNIKDEALNMPQFHKSSQSDQQAKYKSFQTTDNQQNLLNSHHHKIDNENKLQVQQLQKNQHIQTSPNILNQNKQYQFSTMTQYAIPISNYQQYQFQQPQPNTFYIQQYFQYTPQQHQSQFFQQQQQYYFPTTPQNNLSLMQSCYQKMDSYKSAQQSNVNKDKIFNTRNNKNSFSNEDVFMSQQENNNKL